MVDQLTRFFQTPQWGKQHRWRRAIWQTMARMGMTGMHTLPMNRRWVDIHRRRMPITGLDPALVGMRLVHISDLHYSPVVWEKYLDQYIEWINDLSPGVVVITGDLITGGYRFATKVAEILGKIKSEYGTICTFGNHDYSIHGKRANGEGDRRGKFLEKALVDRGLIVLRNETAKICPAGCQSPLLIVGLDDEWCGKLDADLAWRGVDAAGDRAIICLNHNPVNAKELLKYPWQWMLSGHTHGRQVATSRVGKVLYGHRYRHYVHGYYAIEGRHLYVNRGLSYGQRKHHWCRPEITVFKLESADDINHAPATIATSIA